MTQFRHLDIEDGLSQNMITSICQDHKGFMWIGTRDGLNRYDGYSFKIHKVNPNIRGAITDNHITALFEDSGKRLWIGTMYGGLLTYVREKDIFVKVVLKGLPENARFVSAITGSENSGLIVSFLSGHVVRVFLPDSKPEEESLQTKTVEVVAVLGPDESQVPFHVFLSSDDMLWLNGSKGFKALDLAGKGRGSGMSSFPTYVVDYQSGKPVAMKRDDALSPVKNDTQEIKADKDGHVWMTSSHGLYHFDPGRRAFFLYRFARSTTSLLPVRDDSGKDGIWVGTYQHGLGFFNKEDQTIAFIPNKNLAGKELFDMVFRVMCQGNDGNIWLGTNGRGLFFHSPEFSLFRSGRLFPKSKELGISGSVYALCAPEDGTMFYSTLDKFVQLGLGNSRSESYSSETLAARSMVLDKDGVLWLGNQYGLFRYDWRKKNLTCVLDDEKEMILSVHVDEKRQVWYTTYTSLCSFDPITGERTRIPFFSDLTNRMETLLHSTIQPDPDGTLWIGTTDGLFHFDPIEKKFKNVYRNNPDDRQTLSSNEVKCILPDPLEPHRYVWVGTSVGLNRFDKVSGKVSHFTTDDGLPNNTVYGLLPDDGGRLWLSTNHGLSAFDTKTQTFMNFDVKNGLQSNEFNTGAYYRSDNGELFFGGINGYNRFFSKDVLIKQRDLPVVISEINLLGVDESKSYIFSESSVNHLAYDQNNVSITLSVLDYAAPGKIKYAYRIFNRDTTWIETGKSRTITLTSLSPGTYIVQGRGTDSFGRWTSRKAEITFVIAPPWWNSLWARIGYALLLGVISCLWWNRYKRRAAAEQRMELEQQRAAAIIEMDQIKTRFLANITHEFRTPLTLINGHIESMKPSAQNEKTFAQFSEMERNSDHLLRLINQLMDLSKLESGEFKIKYQNRDILADLKAGVFSFHSYAEQKGIALLLEITPETERKLSGQLLAYDDNVFVTILNNLLSNACKFTRSGGTIIVSFRFLSENNEILFTVSDAGPGIPEGELPKIFDRFYQSDSAMDRSYEGSGIGLSLVKELAVLHGGNVTVESNVETGSIFTVSLRVMPGDQAIALPVQPEKRVVSVTPAFASSENTEFPLILVVEDHPDLRQFICNSLGESYRFVEAVNGKEGLLLASQHIPDLVISDVMMPEMNGFEFCSQLKQQELTSHIPVVLLTARVTQEDKLNGLRQGADDYLTKPFSAAELQLRVRNIIAGRKKLLEKHRFTDLSHQTVTAMLPGENLFVERLINIVQNRIGDQAFGVDQLADAVNLSVSQLQRKLKAITGQSPINLIQQIRMEKAIELLRTGKDNIGEVAYQLGFENPGYFSKVFKKYFGFLPSEKEKINTFQKR